MVEKSCSSFWLRAVIQLMIWQVALLALAWLLFMRVNWLSRYNFSDALFLVGLLQVALGGAVLMGSPVNQNGSPWQRMWARSSEASSTRAQILADFAQKEDFFARMAASGLLTILISIVASLINP